MLVMDSVSLASQVDTNVGDHDGDVSEIKLTERQKKNHHSHKGGTDNHRQAKLAIAVVVLSLMQRVSYKINGQKNGESMMMCNK